LRIGFADTIGKRPTMEDEILIQGKLRGRDDEDFVAVYDGHGGRAASEFAAKHLHEVGFILIEVSLTSKKKKRFLSKNLKNLMNQKMP
jgi:serine/threonine protein phosphatase PrpC